MSFNIYDETTWPLDNPEEISIGRAVEMAGRFRFEADWDDKLKASRTLLRPSLPDFNKATARDMAAAWELLPEARVREPPTVTSSYGTRIYLSEPDWQRAAAAISALNEPKLDADASFGAAVLDLREECLAGRLEARAQGFFGEALPIAPALWKTDRFQRWFTTGRASELEITGDWRSDDPLFWVFFDRAQMVKLFSKAPNGEEFKGPTKYPGGDVTEWLRKYWAQFDGEKLHTFSDGKRSTEPRFEKDFAPAMTKKFPGISSGIVRASFDGRPLTKGRRVRD